VIRVTVTVAARHPRRPDGTSPQIDPDQHALEGTVDVAVWVMLRSILLDVATHDPVPTNRDCSGR
jgi:hypothetical protein